MADLAVSMAADEGIDDQDTSSKDQMSGIAASQIRSRGSPKCFRLELPTECLIGHPTAVVALAQQRFIISINRFRLLFCCAGTIHEKVGASNGSDRGPGALCYCRLPERKR